MLTLRAATQLRAAGNRIKGITANAVESALASFEFETSMIPMVVVTPEAKKDCGDEDAVDDRGGGEIKHRAEQIPSSIRTATKKRAGNDSGALQKETGAARGRARAALVQLLGASSTLVAGSTAGAGSAGVLALLPLADLRPLDFL